MALIPTPKVAQTHRLIVAALLSCGLIVIVALTLNAQRRPPQHEDPDDNFQHDVQAKMEKERRDGEWNKLKEDTEKLFQVVNELKEMVEKSNKDTFSIQILKKADEAEKVLKDVKRRAKEGF